MSPSVNEQLITQRDSSSNALFTEPDIFFLAVLVCYLFGIFCSPLLHLFYVFFSLLHGLHFIIFITTSSNVITPTCVTKERVWPIMCSKAAAPVRTANASLNLLCVSTDPSNQSE